MYKTYYKHVQTPKQINAYLRSIGLEIYEISFNKNLPIDYYDFDGWIDSTETKGASVNYYKHPDGGYEIFVTKYDKAYIDSLNK